MQISDLPKHLLATAAHHSGIAVVVCTYRRPRELERCLRSLRGQALAPAQIVVADNAPSSAAVRHLAEAAGAQYVAVPIRGVSRARNAGARHCTTALVAYIDDDMVAHPDWLRALRSAFADPGVIAVTGPVMPMPLMQASPANLALELQRQPWGAKPFQVARDCADWFERAHFGGLGDGNMAFRLAAFEDWPGFEERIGRGSPIGGGEEHFAFFELIERGHRVAYMPEAIVFHPEKEGTRAELLRSISETAAYSCFVAASRPSRAWRVLRYLIQGLQGRRRAWRPGGERIFGNRVSKLGALLAFVRGIAAFGLSRNVQSHACVSQPRPLRESSEATQQ